MSAINLLWRAPDFPAGDSDAIGRDAPQKSIDTQVYHKVLSMYPLCGPLFSKKSLKTPSEPCGKLRNDLLRVPFFKPLFLKMIFENRNFADLPFRGTGARTLVFCLSAAAKRQNLQKFSPTVATLRLGFACGRDIFAFRRKPKDNPDGFLLEIFPSGKSVLSYKKIRSESSGFFLMY